MDNRNCQPDFNSCVVCWNFAERKDEENLSECSSINAGWQEKTTKKLMKSVWL